MSDHDEHGRGDSDGGPADPDCPCRKGPHQKECASAGCGFCICAENRKPKPVSQLRRAVRWMYQLLYEIALRFGT